MLVVLLINETAVDSSIDFPFHDTQYFLTTRALLGSRGFKRIEAVFKGNSKGFPVGILRATAIQSPSAQIWVFGFSLIIINFG